MWCESCSYTVIIDYMSNYFNKPETNITSCDVEGETLKQHIKWCLIALCVM